MNVDFAWVVTYNSSRSDYACNKAKNNINSEGNIDKTTYDFNDRVLQKLWRETLVKRNDHTINDWQYQNQNIPPLLNWVFVWNNVLLWNLKLCLGVFFSFDSIHQVFYVAQLLHGNGPLVNNFLFFFFLFIKMFRHHSCLLPFHEAFVHSLAFLLVCTLGYNNRFSRFEVSRCFHFPDRLRVGIFFKSGVSMHHLTISLINRLIYIIINTLLILSKVLIMLAFALFILFSLSFGCFI